MTNNYKAQEYLITNGLGSFSSGTVSGPKTRKYHGILNASLEPPIKRHLLISDLKTYVGMKDTTYLLENESYLENFSTHIHPTFDYKIHDVTVTKTLAMVYLENTVAVVYDIKTSEAPVTLKVEIFSNFRDHHDLTSNDFIHPEIHTKDQGLTLSHPLSSVYISGFSPFKNMKPGVKMFNMILKHAGVNQIQKDSLVLVTLKSPLPLGQKKDWYCF